ncbi:unnamed protein product [Brassica rapa subsp. narinosa]
MSCRHKLEICVGAARGTISIQVLQEPSYIRCEVCYILLDENFMAKVAELGLSKTGPYLDQTHVSLTEKVLCGTPHIDPYISRKKVNLSNVRQNW